MASTRVSIARKSNSVTERDQDQDKVRAEGRGRSDVRQLRCPVDEDLVEGALDPGDRFV